jgi:hypothetical protein
MRDGKLYIERRDQGDYAIRRRGSERPARLRLLRQIRSILRERSNREPLLTLSVSAIQTGSMSKGVSLEHRRSGAGGTGVHAHDQKTRRSRRILSRSGLPD